MNFSFSHRRDVHVFSVTQPQSRSPHPHQQLKGSHIHEIDVGQRRGIQSPSSRLSMVTHQSLLTQLRIARLHLGPLVENVSVTMFTANILTKVL